MRIAFDRRQKAELVSHCVHRFNNSLQSTHGLVTLLDLVLFLGPLHALARLGDLARTSALRRGGIDDVSIDTVVLGEVAQDLLDLLVDAVAAIVVHLTDNAGKRVEGSPAALLQHELDHALDEEGL